MEADALVEVARAHAAAEAAEAAAAAATAALRPRPGPRLLAALLPSVSPLSARELTALLVSLSRRNCGTGAGTGTSGSAGVDGVGGVDHCCEPQRGAAVASVVGAVAVAAARRAR
eukprot:297482-Chlamydomonas_euryale.AAC.1